ncbi:low-density lipoprotein receptor-related protein 5-like protein [Haliotis cracherodii]|uniref:low-density lipoprotein receptor-related protein 5-like protein n=1 Tax=Haliotis cracherodii TaxID=6455 RepID=UPI0039E747EF
MYWTDVLLKQINATDLTIGTTQLILSLNDSAIPDGISVDSSSRKIFYTDTGNDVIAVMDMNGSNHDIIVTQELDEPRDIVLHEANRTMYWTDWGTAPYIATADYDGRNIRKIVTTGLGWPNGLTLDRNNGILYWCDAKTHKVESVTVEGTQRRELLNEPGAHYFGISFHDGTLYFTDWRRLAILHIPATGGTLGVIATTNLTQLAGIHVFSNRNASGNIDFLQLNVC